MSLIQALKARQGKDDSSLVQLLGSAAIVASQEGIALATAPTESTYDTINATLDSLKQDHSLSSQYSEEQLAAAATSAILASSQESFKRHLASSKTVKDVPTGVKLVNKGESFVEVDSKLYSAEAYDVNNSRQIMAMAASYNLVATGQDAFNKAFWQLVVIEPNQALVSITVSILNIIKDSARRNDISSTENWGDTNVLASRVVPGVLDNQQLDLVPVFIDTGAPETKTDRFFVDKTVLAPTNTLVAGTEVSTSYLKFGVNVPDYIKLATPAHIVQNGVLDMTDTMDGAVALSSVAFALKGSIIAVSNLENNGQALFTPSMVGDTERMTLNALITVPLTAATKDASGAVIADLAFLGTKVASIRLGFSGRVVRDRASDLSVDMSTPQIAFITDDKGVQLPSSDAAYAALQALIDDADTEKLGYKLNAKRSNTNVRVRGTIVNERATADAYAIGRMSPMTYISPAAAESINQDQSAENAARSLGALVKAQCDAAGVKALLDYFDSLVPYVAAGAKAYDTEASATFGPGRLLVKPHIYNETFALSDLVQTLNSSDKPEDLQAAIVSMIRQVAVDLMRESRLQAAYDFAYPGKNVKPKLIVGTDNVIDQWLWREGDPRTFGPLEGEVVSTTINSMRDTIIIGFSDPENPQESVLQTGRLFYAPEVVTNLTLSRNGAFNRELTVHPRYKHVASLPVLAKIKITGLSAFFESVTPIRTVV